MYLLTIYCICIYCTNDYVLFFHNGTYLLHVYFALTTCHFATYLALKASATAPDTIGAAAEFWLKSLVVLSPISVVFYGINIY